MDGFDDNSKVTNAFRAQVEPLCSVATGLVSAMWSMREGASHIPSERSRAMAELAQERTLAGAWGDGPARLAHSIAVLQLMGAEDGIHAVCELVLADRASIFSHLTVLGVVVMDDGGLLFFLALITVACCAVVLFIERRSIPLVGARL